MKKSLWINVVITVAIVIFLNLLAVSMFSRFDFSKGKMYSLSETSKSTVASLDDRLVVKAYFSENLPPQYADARRYTEDILSEYAAYSKGKLKYEFIDPASQVTLKAEAQKNMIQPVQMQINENDKMEIREVYMGLAFLYQGKTETIPLVQKTQGLEYDITLSLKKIKSAGQKKIAIFKPEAISRDMWGRAKDNYSTLNDLISASYEKVEVDLQNKIDDDVDGLIVTAISDSLTANQLFNLDQYIMTGGNVVFFQDRVKAEIRTQQAEEINSNLFDVLSYYGVNVKNNLVADASCGQVNMTRKQGFFNVNTPVNYPFINILKNFNSDNEIISNIEVMSMIFASEIDTTNIAEGIVFTPLIYTSNNSKRVMAPRYDIGINNYINKDLKILLTEPRAVVAGLYEGAFKSYFANNPDFASAKNESLGSKIIFVSDSEILRDDAGASTKPNMEFTLNTIDYIAGDASMIQLRSRGTEYKPLKEDISVSKRKWVKWTNILLPSFLLLLVGAIIFRIGYAKKRLLEAKYE